MSDKITIRNSVDERVEAITPVIISASRSTDIPAFMPSGFSTAWQKAIVLGTIRLISKRYIYLSVSVGL